MGLSTHVYELVAALLQKLQLPQCIAWVCPFPNVCTFRFKMSESKRKLHKVDAAPHFSHVPDMNAAFLRMRNRTRLLWRERFLWQREQDRVGGWPLTRILWITQRSCRQSRTCRCRHEENLDAPDQRLCFSPCFPLPVSMVTESRRVRSPV